MDNILKIAVFILQERLRLQIKMRLINCGIYQKRLLGSLLSTKELILDNE